MNISSQGENITLQSGDTKVLLSGPCTTIDEYVVDFPGEFERRGVFIEVRETNSHLLFILTIEGRTVIYLPEGTTAESLESLRDLNNKDVVIFPANETLWKTVESWEASVVAPYGAKVTEFLTKLGQTPEILGSGSIKSTDFESEVTRFVALG